MKNINKEQVYINLDTKYSVELNTNIYIEDIAKVYCKDKTIEEKVKKIKIYNSQNQEMYDYISGNDIVTKVLDKVQNIDVAIIGGPDVLVEVKGKEQPKILLNFLKITLVCIILFFGSALAVINFFEDVEMENTFERIYYLITGTRQQNIKIIAIPFSIGIGLGIFTFFNRIVSFNKRRRQEPGPLELELYLYDKNLEDNIMNDIKKSDNS